MNKLIDALHWRRATVLLLISLLFSSCAESDDQSTMREVRTNRNDENAAAECEPYEVFSVPDEAEGLYLHWELPDGDDSGLAVMQPGLEEPIHVIEVPAEMQDFYSDSGIWQDEDWAVGFYEETIDDYSVPFFVNFTTGEIFRLPRLAFGGAMNQAGTMLVGVPAEASGLEGNPISVAYKLPCGGVIARYDIRDELERYRSGGPLYGRPTSGADLIGESRVRVAYEFGTGGNGVFVRDVIYEPTRAAPLTESRRVFHPYHPIAYYHGSSGRAGQYGFIVDYAAGYIEFNEEFDLSDEAQLLLRGRQLPFENADFNPTIGVDSPLHSHVVIFLNGDLWHINGPKKTVYRIGPSIGVFRFSRSYAAGYPSFVYVQEEDGQLFIQGYDLEAEEQIDRLNLTDVVGYTPQDEVLITEAEYPYVEVYATKPSVEQLYHLINVQDRTDVLPATVEFTDDPGK